MCLTVFFLATIMALSEGQIFAKESKFQEEPMCDLQERIEEGCSREEPARSLVDCIAKCGLELSCIGASMEKNTGKCFFHKDCGMGSACSLVETTHTYFARYCIHGEWDPVADSCVCVLGTFGDRCDKAHKDCYRLEPAGFPPGSYKIYIDPYEDGRLYLAYCSTALGGFVAWHIAVNNGEMSFNRTWSEYINGFMTDDMSSYWMGLKLWHILSTQLGSMHAYIGVSVKSGTVGYMWLINFVVGSKTDNFKYTFISGNILFNGGTRLPYHIDMSCMGYSQNTPFSTWDRPNGLDENCPAQFASGWWFPQDCSYPCNYLAWGLEDWNAQTSRQRFAAPGIPISQQASDIDSLWIYLANV